MESRSDTFITGPSFLGLSAPGPAHNRPSRDHLPASSGNLDYLLDDEEERKRGWGKFFLVVVALALALGFGYLRWKQGGFNWLTASKKPSVAAPDAAQTSRGPAGSEDSAPVPTGSTPATPPSGEAANPSDPASSQATPSQTPPAQTAAAPNPAQDPNASAQNAVQQNTDIENKSADSSPPPNSAAQSTGSDDAASSPVETPAPKAKAHKVAPAKPTAAKPYDSVGEAERYIYGRGVTQDCDHGLRLLKPAAEQSNPQAMISLAALYSTGTCTPRDLPTAYRWFAQALHKQPDNQALQDDLKNLWAKMTPPERQLAIKLSQ